MRKFFLKHSPDPGLRRRIHRAGGIIQYEYLRFLEYGPCDTQALFLSP